jgi:hypothetical protein
LVDIVERIDPAGDGETRANLTLLRARVPELWESASRCCVAHQDVLAILENGVIQASNEGAVTLGQLQAFYWALYYLSCPFIPTNNEWMRALFFREGFGPLAFVGEGI